MTKAVAMLLAAALGLGGLAPLADAQQGKFAEDKKKPNREEAREKRRVEREERRAERKEKRESRMQKKAGQGVTAK